MRKLNVGETLFILGFSVAMLGCEISTNRFILDEYFTYYFTDYKKSLQDLGREYNIKIDYAIDNDFIDKEWQLPPHNGKAYLIDDFELARFSNVLPTVLKKYPKDLIGKNIEYVKLSRSLEFYGVGFGATNKDSSIYLSSNGRQNGYTDFYLRQGFHHEFSSILLHNYNFPVESWRSANLGGFEYLDDFKGEIKSIDEDTDLTGEEQYYQNGVIAKYSYTNYENDFNLFAQMVFNEPDRLKKLVSKYPIIKKKYLIVKEFYLSISPFFEDTFRKIL